MILQARYFIGNLLGIPIVFHGFDANRKGPFFERFHWFADHARSRAESKSSPLFGYLSPHIIERDVKFQGLQLAIPVIQYRPGDHGNPSVVKAYPETCLDIFDQNPGFIIFEIGIARSQQVGDHHTGRACLGLCIVLISGVKEYCTQKYDKHPERDKNLHWAERPLRLRIKFNHLWDLWLLPRHSRPLQRKGQLYRVSFLFGALYRIPENRAEAQVQENLYLATIDGTPALAEGVNADGSWRRTGEDVQNLAGVEAAALAVQLDLSLPLDLMKRYTNLGVRAYASLDGHDVIVVNGHSSPDVIETMYFDRASGLLLRRVVRLGTAMGPLPVQVDYAVYRAVGQVKAAFEVRVADWASVRAMKFTDILLNPSLDDSHFAKPAMQAK